MASPGLLFLLLVSSSLLLSTVSSPATPDKAKLKKAGEIARKTIQVYKAVGKPILQVIPGLGILVSILDPILDLALVGLADKGILDDIKYEFESLNEKLDKYHDEQEWNTWASGAYHKSEKDIQVAWNMYVTLIQSLKNASPGNTERVERLKQEIINDCSKYQSATKDLHVYLTAGGTTFINNLGEMLAKHVRCHENDILEYIMFINKLIYKGNMLSLMCYQHKKIETQDIADDISKIAYESAQALFQMYKTCISNSIDYVKKDVKELIGAVDNRQELADKIQSFLTEKYYRYDWTVVAFITENSAHKRIKTLNKHVLSGFITVEKWDVTVAVARQVKGKHTKADGIKKDIGKCMEKLVDCHKVPKTLNGCGISNKYTAVHAYRDKSHQSSSPDTTAESPEQEESDEFYQFTSAKTEYTYEGTCKKDRVSTKVNKGGKFVVMIKSDEEIERKDPCSDQNYCGGVNRGTCVFIKDILVAVCDCKHPYYGEKCEMSLDKYKEDLKQELKVKPVVKDSRRQNQPVKRSVL